MFRMWVVAGVLLVACKQQEPPPAPPPAPKPAAASPTSKVGAPLAPGALKRTSVDTSYVVAMPAGAEVAVLEKRARANHPDVEVTRVSLADLFDDEALAFMTKALPPADAEAVRGATAVLRLRVSGTGGMKLVRELAEATRDVADAAHGWVLDPETFRSHPAAAFHAHVPGDPPDVRKLIMVHSIMGGNQQPFLDTAGLRRYGLPELHFAEAATGQVNQVNHLMNAVAQTLLEGGDVNERGELAIDFRKLGWNIDIVGAGTGTAVLQARWARERDAGDDAELVVELVPPAGAGPEGAAKLIDECFGHRPDTFTMTKDGDPELLAAGVKARADLGRLRAHFAKGIPPDERLSIKAKFTDDEGQVEWMWVDVVAFRGNQLQGTLDNDPRVIRSLRNGQKVTVTFADVADYLHDTKGAKSAGGYSIEVYEQRGLTPSDTD